MSAAPWYAASLFLMLLDQWVKQVIVNLLALCVPGHCESIDILPFFKLTLLHNRGAAFSFLDDAGGWQRWFLTVVSLLVSLAMAIWLYRVHRQQKLLAAALCLILGGALGNLVDRAIQGYVVDFFVLHHGGWYFPAFNIADAAISVGAALLLLDMLTSHRRNANGANQQGVS